MLSTGLVVWCCNILCSYILLECMVRVPRIYIFLHWCCRLIEELRVRTLHFRNYCSAEYGKFMFCVIVMLSLSSILIIISVTVRQL